MTTGELLIEAANRLEAASIVHWRTPTRPPFCKLCFRDMVNSNLHHSNCLVERLRAASQQEMPEGLRRLIRQYLNGTVFSAREAQMAEITAEYAKGAGS